MTPNDGPRREDVNEWFLTVVTEGVDDLIESDIDAPHVPSDWHRGLLAWFAKQYVDDDPAELVYSDGPSDGGIDIASIRDLEDIWTIQVFQVSSPRPGGPAPRMLKTKLQDDVRQFHKTVTGQATLLRNLNPTARNLLRQINNARESAKDLEHYSPPVRIEIHLT